MFASATSRAAAAAVLLALLILPAPLLPPLGLAGQLQSALGIGWKPAYLIATIGLHVVLYGSLGVVAAFAVGPGPSTRQQRLRMMILPVMVVGIAVLVRSVKLGHVPMFANAVVPIAACALGVGIGFLFRQRGWRVTLVALVVLLAGLLWACWPAVSSDLGRNTEAQLRRLVESSPGSEAGEERFGVLLQTVFAPMPSATARATAVEHNRAAILALGIAIGHERLATLAGLDRGSELVRAAAALRPGTTLRGREDWARHYCLSAALAVVETPFLSDTGGLIKEELDALARGSGFSFGDLAADRAGVRLARAATDSEPAAQAMRARLQAGFVVDDFMPTTADLPESLSAEQFRHDYGGVGSKRYRQTVSEIEARLNRCAALSAPQFSQRQPR
ncbi:MAG: hypothetical protein KJ070_12970 [Verrucomicrobia bacterium]|nr:hypothetical protein [Verrucomicrobiota bacterium]